MGIKCQICDAEFHFITSTHLKTHGMTVAEYKEKYGADSISSPEHKENVGKGQKGLKTGDDNPARRDEVRKQISETVKDRWREGCYAERVNGMLGKTGEDHFSYDPEKHTPTYLAEQQYVDFLSNFQDVTVCSRCGCISRKMNVHHIDEDHTNFLPSNLEPLCVPCHAAFHYNNRKRPFVTVGKEFSFAAAHFLPKYNGACANIHGHEWKLMVHVTKRIDPDTDMVMDFKDLKKVVTTHVIDVLDHGFLNDIIEVPTAELLLVWVWEQLMFKAQLKGISAIDLWESPGSKATLTLAGMLSTLKANCEEYMDKYKIELSQS